jgi:hypothetical protein
MGVLLIAITISLSQFLDQTAEKKPGGASWSEFSASAELKIARWRGRGQE